MILFGLPFPHNTITDFWRYKEFKRWCAPLPHFNKKEIILFLQQFYKNINTSPMIK